MNERLELACIICFTLVAIVYLGTDMLKRMKNDNYERKIYRLEAENKELKKQLEKENNNDREI